ncbi:hypothetical protein Tco_0039374 [Tanacetum coccineum]
MMMVMTRWWDGDEGDSIGGVVEMEMNVIVVLLWHGCGCRTVFREPPYLFDHPMRRLTMEEILAKFIDEGRREHEEMEIFIKEFRTTNELLLKTRNNLLSELKIENEPPRFKQDVREKPHDDGGKNKSSSIHERTTQPLVKPPQSSIPFQNRVRKEKEEALQRNFLENLKQLDINIPFIEALVQIPKYAKYLKNLLTNKSRLEEACTETMNERCSTVLLNELPVKEKDPRSFTTPCQVFEKPKEAEDLAADHLSSLITMNDDNIMRRCVAGSETLEILAHCHSRPTVGHHSANVTGKKVYEFRFYWPSVFKDANEYDVMHVKYRETYLQGTKCLKITFRAIKQIKHKALWALKQCNMDLTLARESRFMQLNELAELRDGDYENTRIYKERTKKWHDSRLRGDKDFKVGDQVLLYNSRLKMYPRKHKSKWSGPNIVKTVYPYGAIEITNRDGFSFKVNGQRLKKYYEGNIDKKDDEVLEFEDGVT